MLNKPDDFIAPVCHTQIEILYQDDAILVINKPSGLLSLSGKNPLNKDSVHYRLVQDYPTALMVHRLDLGTSGLMVLALSKDVVRHLNRQFSERRVHKQYHAVVRGCVQQDTGTINFPIAKGPFPYQVICEVNGKPAKTEFKVCHRFSDKTVLELTPFTGRTHQLRIHCAQIGHAILGDDLYGESYPEEFLVHNVRENKEVHDSEGMKTINEPIENKQKGPVRLMLHASQLTFVHPLTGKKLVFHCKAGFE